MRWLFPTRSTNPKGRSPGASILPRRRAGVDGGLLQLRFWFRFWFRSWCRFWP